MTDDDFLPPSTTPTPVGLSPGTAAGLAALLIGCTLLVSACVLMAFNVILFGHFSHGMRGIPMRLSQFGAFTGLMGVLVLGFFGIVLGIRGWSAATKGEGRALGIAATAASIVGLIAWLIASISLMMILLTPAFGG
jgi:hypothetical protein